MGWFSFQMLAKAINVQTVLYMACLIQGSVVDSRYWGESTSRAGDIDTYQADTTMVSDLDSTTRAPAAWNNETDQFNSLGNNSTNEANTTHVTSPYTSKSSVENGELLRKLYLVVKGITIAESNVLARDVSDNLTNRQRRSTGCESLSERTVCPWRSITSSFTDHVPNIVREVECVSTEPTVSGTTLTCETIYEYKRLERRSCQTGNNETCHQIVKVAVGCVTTLLCMRDI